jgi:flagellin-like protein
VTRVRRLIGDVLPVEASRNPNSFSVSLKHGGMIDDGIGLAILGNRGVSSAIGTVLMVALVVVLVATVSLTVFSLTGGEITTAERALEQFDSSLDKLSFVFVPVP